MFSRALLAAMRWRWVTIAVTVALFLPRSSACGSSSSSSSRPRTVRSSSSTSRCRRTPRSPRPRRRWTASRARALAGDPDIDRWSSYVGQGAVRFLLSFDVQPANPFFGQIIIVTKNFEARERVKARLERIAREQFVGTDVLVTPLALGPPSGRPVQYRVSGPEIQQVRKARAGSRRDRRREPARRQPGLRLERAGAGREGRGAAGQGPPARRQLRGHRRDLERAGRRFVGHAGARRHLPHQRRRTRARGRARLDRHVPEPPTARQERTVGAARRGRDLPLRAGAAGRMAAQPRADHHRQGEHPRRDAARDRGQRSSSRACASSRDALPPATTSRSPARSRTAPRRRGRSPPSSR